MVCVDRTWLGNCEVFPRGARAADRSSLYIARVNQYHVVPLMRAREDAQATVSRESGSSGVASRASDSAGKSSGDDLPPSAGEATQAETGRSSLSIEPRRGA